MNEGHNLLLVPLLPRLATASILYLVHFVMSSGEGPCHLGAGRGTGTVHRSGYEGSPFTVTQEEAEAEAFTVKARAEYEAEEDREEEEAAFTVKAKTEEEAAFTVQAKAEEEVEDSDDDCDSDEEAGLDHDEFMARLIADYNAESEKIKADNPWLTYTDYSTEEYAYMRRNPEEVEEESDDDSDEKLRIYADMFRQLGGEGSHVVDGLVLCRALLRFVHFASVQIAPIRIRVSASGHKYVISEKLSKKRQYRDTFDYF
ncbi:hypothetical protein CFC21_019702 [Triticum aestivum]|uniref:Uncharacterized protein n=3 Tax=Triticum TaxID=4564 RepID=A0A9R1P8E0_TRITD|nr:hypothetical protein CFC21_019702 [Triticum aestivum]VAH38188.1 unnamed protein product [Triticum turgidum subsp. durum]